MSDQDESPLKFPCEFPIKAMGPAGAGLRATVLRIVRRHAPDLDADRVHVNESRHGRYLSVTVPITARSREQLDAIYHDLQADGAVLATL